MSEVEKLPRLIQRAAAMLEKATNAGEILEAREQANVAYTAAKMAAHLTKIKDAHDTVLAACRKAMADALVIEARAQCRLADEYDAAQERGEVRKDGQRGKAIPNENSLSTVKDIGLTSKQVHEARAVRDAEKEQPGIIRKTVEDKLQANEEPTRADVRRAIKPASAKASNKPSRGTPTLDRARAIVRPLIENNKPIQSRRLQDVHGITHQYFEAASYVEKALKEQAPIDASTLPMTAQQKLDAAIRAHKRKLDAEFEMRVLEECKRRLDEISLPHYAKQLAELERSIKNRKGLMKRITYKKIIACLHPDRVLDTTLKSRYEEAFRLFNDMEKLFLDEKESPTEFRTLPRTYEELMRMKAKVQAERRAKRAGKSAPSVRA